jgi:hypothetical protein
MMSAIRGGVNGSDKIALFELFELFELFAKMIFF